MRIVIVEDHNLMRDLLRAVCHRHPRCEVAGEASDGQEAVETILRTKPGLVLLDIGLPDINGFEVIEVLRRAHCFPRVLLFSAYCDDYTVYRAEKLGVQGFVAKTVNTVVALRDAMTEVSAGRSYFCQMYRNIRSVRRDDPRSFDKVLTDRELQVLALVGELLTDREVAMRLGTSNQTAEKHRFNLLRKLGLDTKAELVRYARDHGFRWAVKPLAPQAGARSPNGVPVGVLTGGY